MTHVDHPEAISTGEHRLRKTVTTIVVLIVTVALSVAGVSALRHAEARQAGAVMEAPPEEGVAVDVAEIESRRIHLRVSASGFVEPYESLTLAAEVPGLIQKQHVEASARVKIGDPLIQIDDSLHVIALNKAQAAVESAKSELELATEDVARVERLETQDSANPREMLGYETALEIAQAKLKQADASVTEAETLLGKSAVRAPITGEIARVHTRQGEYAHVGQPLVDIIETGRLKLIVQLNDRQIVAFEPGDPAELRVPALPGERFSGTILRIPPRAIPDSRKFEVEIEVDNASGKLKAGFFVEAILTQRDAPANQTEIVVIPRLAVFELYRQNYCYVVRPDAGDTGTLRAYRTQIEVVPLQSDPKLGRVFSGVELGEQVITDGLQHVTHESVVRVVP